MSGADSAGSQTESADDQAAVSASNSGLIRSAAAFEERFDVSVPKAFGSADRMTWKLAAPHHAIDGHLGDLEHPRKLAHGVKLGLVRTCRFSFHPSYPFLD
jgi:hypothetical protein